MCAVCMHMCKHVSIEGHLYIGGCTCMCVCMVKVKVDVLVFLDNSPPYILRQDLLLEPRALDSDSLVIQRALGTLSSPSRIWDYRKAAMPTLHVYIDTGALNSCP